jgi:hypothetical protein
MSTVTAILKENKTKPAVQLKPTITARIAASMLTASTASTSSAKQREPPPQPAEHIVSVGLQLMLEKLVQLIENTWSK